MKLRFALAVFATTLALASAARAQEPQQPVEDDTPTMTSDDATPTMTTDDVASPTVFNAGSIGGDASGALGRFYATLGTNGVSEADIVSIRARIDGGGELATGVSFDVAADGRVLNPTLYRKSGFATYDDAISREFARNPGRLSMIAGFTGVRIDVAVGRAGMRVSASGTAPKVDVAAAIESLVAEMRRQSPNPENVSLRRSGAALSLNLRMPFDAAPK